MNANDELIDVEEQTSECPSCGEKCYPSDLLPGGEHFVYSEGRLAGYCEKSLAGMSDEDIGYTNDELVQCKKHNVYIPWGLDCPLCLADELGDEESYDEESYDEEAYQQHIANEGTNTWNSNPDGCFFCGGDHHSDCCPDRH